MDWTKHDELAREIDKLTQTSFILRLQNLPTEDSERLHFRQELMRTETELAIALARLEAERLKMVNEALTEYTTIRRAPLHFGAKGAEYARFPLEGMHNNWRDCTCISCEMARKAFADLELWQQCLAKAKLDIAEKYSPDPDLHGHISERMVQEFALDLFEARKKQAASD
jgi:hypothetical protein